MHYGTTFHASQLDDHLAKFQKDEVPLIARKSSLSGANQVHLYSLLVQTPSGKVPLPIPQAVALSQYSCVRFLPICKDGVTASSQILDSSELLVNFHSNVLLTALSVLFTQSALISARSSPPQLLLLGMGLEPETKISD